MLLSIMLDSHSEEQATEAEIARKKHTKFPGKQKWKNGEMFYILKNEEETANIRFCNFIVKNVYSKKKKKSKQNQRKLLQFLHLSGTAIIFMNYTQ